MRLWYERGEIEETTLTAWEDIASGDPSRVVAGNEALLHREQLDVIQHRYDEMRAHHGAVGEAFTDGLTWMADAPIPGGLAYRQVVTRHVEVEVDTPRLPLVGWDPPDPHAHLTLPRGNLAEFAERWEWISRDMLPAYRRLVEDPDAMRALVNQPVADRALERRWLGDLAYPTP